MKLIVALGNPTPKYAKTRHNVGFMALDFFIQNTSDSQIFNAQSRDFTMNAKFNAEILKCEKIIFAKPQTFMNASGEAVKRIADFYKISEIAVIHDDLDLSLGAVRFKFGGGNAGHNGLKSIDSLMGDKYLRIRIGIGTPKNKTPIRADFGANRNANNQSTISSTNIFGANQTTANQSANLSPNRNAENLTQSRESIKTAILDFVLGDFSDDEMNILQPTFEIVANAICSFANGANLQTLQNAYTKKK